MTLPAAARRRHGRRRSLRERLAERAAALRTRAAAATEPVRAPLRPLTEWVSRTGWLVLVAALVCLLLAWLGGWGEFGVAGWTLLAGFLLCLLLTLGRTDLEVSLVVHPPRVVAGNEAHGGVDIRNRRRGLLLPVALEVPVGRSRGRFYLPPLKGGQRHGERFHVPTDRRSVVPIGPAVTVRGDPFGLLHRTVRWTEQLELFVHPRLAAVASLDSGLLRDLEGQTTNDLSVSDLAFHALREYAPGDDRRLIHWRSTAKLVAATGASQFMVRQFLDTRRSQLCVVIDADDLSYGDTEEFETAISAGASVAVRGIRDEVVTTLVAGEFSAHESTESRTLDTLSRTRAHRAPLSSLTADAVRLAPAVSVALIVTGRHADFGDIRLAASNFAADVAVHVLRVDPGQPVRASLFQGMSLLTIGSLADLPRLLGRPQ